MSKLAQPIIGKDYNTKLGLNVTFAILRNPWPHRVPNSKLKEIVVDALYQRAGQLSAMKSAGEVDRAAMGFALTDPTAPPYVSSLDAVMVVASVNSGSPYAVNGISKAVTHRDAYLLDVEMKFNLEENDLEAVLEEEPLRVPDGAFGWNGSAYYKGCFSGGSGASARQDGEQALAFAMSVYDEAEKVAKAWEGEHERGWFCNQNLPDRAVATLAAILEEAEEPTSRTPANTDPLEAYGPDNDRSTVYQAD